MHATLIIPAGEWSVELSQDVAIRPGLFRGAALPEGALSASPQQALAGLDSTRESPPLWRGRGTHLWAFIIVS